LGREAIGDLAGAITGADGERNLTPEEIGTIETSLAALKRSRLGPHESAFAALELKFADYKKVNSCV
jgi:hypothetical protein